MLAGAPTTLCESRPVFILLHCMNCRYGNPTLKVAPDLEGAWKILAQLPTLSLTCYIHRLKFLSKFILPAPQGSCCLLIFGICLP